MYVGPWTGFQAPAAGSARPRVPVRGRREALKILLVDTDHDLVDILSFTLRRAGFWPLAAYGAEQALSTFERERPSLAILGFDLGSPGCHLLKAIRRAGDIPVIILTDDSEERGRVQDLGLDAADYVSKPFNHRELIARIQARLRRLGALTVDVTPDDEGVIEVGPLRMDARERVVTLSAASLNLTVTEFRLLRFLMSNPGMVLPAGLVLRDVWGYDEGGATEILRVTVHRLRRKLMAYPEGAGLLHTVPGVGIMLSEGPPRPEPVQG